MTDVGTAALQIIPSFKGFSSKLQSGATKDMTSAGTKAGDAFGESAAKSGGDGFSSKIGGSIKGAAVAGAGLAVGMAFGGAIASALENEALSDKLAAQLGVGAQKSKELGDVAGNLYSNAFGDSMGGVNDAIRQVVTNIDGMRNASKSKLEDITATVLNLNAAFDEEPASITRAAAQMQRTGLAGSTKEALDIITAGFQSGADKAQDLLDTYNEYGTQFRKLGIDGAQATGLITQGLKAGARDADLVADTFKEFSIRAVDGSTTTAAGFKALGLSADDMAERIGKGGKSAADATELVLNKLRGIEDPAKRAQAAVGLFGTQSEDMGQALYALDLPKAARQFDDVAGASKRMGDTLNDNAQSKITTFTRKLKMGVVDFLGNEVIPAISRFADGPEGKALGDTFSNMADDVRPMAESLLPAVAKTLGTVADALATAAPYAKDMVDAFNGMPDWAKKGLVIGGATAYAGSKLGLGSLLGSKGGAGSGGSGLLGAFTKTAPMPVYVVNSVPGVGGKVGPGGMPVVAGGGASSVVGGAGAAAKSGFGAKVASIGRGIAPFVPILPGVSPDTIAAPKMVGGIKEFNAAIAASESATKSAATAVNGYGDALSGASKKVRNLVVSLPDELVTEMKLKGIPQSAQQAIQLSRKYDLAAKDRQTLFKTAGISQAQAEVARYALKITSVPKWITSSIQLTGVEAAQQQIASLISSIHAIPSIGSHDVPFVHGGQPSGRVAVPGGRPAGRSTINIHLDGRVVGSVTDERIGTYEDLANERRRAGAR